MKSILMSIKPYYGFLIIAAMKGWDLAKYNLHEKTVEVRKGVPTSPDWDKEVALYFSKDKKSLARIPEEYRGEVAKLCGTVVCEFVCDEIENIDIPYPAWDKCYLNPVLDKSCLTYKELHNYGGSGKRVFGLHISDLKIYDKPKRLSEFRKPCDKFIDCLSCKRGKISDLSCNGQIELAPQSWNYCEEQ